MLLVIEQYFTSAAILRTHAYRPLGRPADPFDLTLHAVHTRVGLLIFALVAARLVLRVTRAAPEWLTPLPHWRLRLSSSVQFALYVVLLGQAVTGGIATYLWWPISSAHKAHIASQRGRSLVRRSASRDTVSHHRAAAGQMKFHGGAQVAAQQGD